MDRVRRDASEDDFPRRRRLVIFFITWLLIFDRFCAGEMQTDARGLKCNIFSNQQKKEYNFLWDNSSHLVVSVAHIVFRIISDVCARIVSELSDKKILDVD